MARTCPLCHQHYAVERLGVRLPPLKAGIFDAVKQAGDVGVTSTEIVAGSLYRERRHASHDTIKAHVWQINDLLEETDWIIRSESDYGTSERRWHLRQRRMRKAAGMNGGAR